MHKTLFLHTLVIFLLFGLVPQAYSAVSAHATIGSDMHVGKYNISGMTEQEQKWFSTFLEGTFFTDGWKQISSHILIKTNPNERDLMKTRLDEIGFKIGSEWCKENDSRKINTSMLKKWGKDLRKTAENDPHLLDEVLQRILTEVDELIN